jgi:tryptophanyl-tRNA synthetase
LADLAVAKLSPIASEMNRLLGDRAELDRILQKGAERAGAIAEKTVNEVKDIVGLVRF